MPEKQVSNIDWKDQRDVELVRLNMQCMSLAVQLTGILVNTTTPVDIVTPFKLANKIYKFVTFSEVPDASS